jgi:hypothetical protein
MMIADGRVGVDSLSFSSMAGRVAIVCDHAHRLS